MRAFEVLVLVAVVVVVVVVASIGVGSTPVRPQNSADNQVDFEALNSYLRAKLGDNEDKEANLALIKADKDSFKGEDQMGLKMAAGVAAKLAEVGAKSDCDDQLLVALRSARAGGMNSYEELASDKRIERLIRPELIVALDTCAKYIVKTFPKHLKGENVNLRVMSDLISPDKQQQLSDDYDWPGSDFLAEVLKELSSADPKNKKDPWTYGQTSKLRMFEDRDTFNYVYRKYLADPCGQLRHSLGKFFEAALAISKMRGQLADFAHYTLDEFRQMARTNYLCKRIAEQANDYDATRDMYLSRAGW